MMAVNTSYTYISPHPYLFFTSHGNRNTNLTEPPQPILTYTLMTTFQLTSSGVQRQLCAGLTPLLVTPVNFGVESSGMDSLVAASQRFFAMM